MSLTYANSAIVAARQQIAPGRFLDAVVAEIEATGECLMHASHVVACRSIDAGPRCSVCGGGYAQGHLHGAHPTAHYLCIERAKRNLRTPRMDDYPTCNCWKCSEAERRMGC